MLGLRRLGLKRGPGHLVQRVPNTGTAKGTWWVIVVESGVSFLMPEIWHEDMEQGAQTYFNSAMHRPSHRVEEGAHLGFGQRQEEVGYREGEREASSVLGLKGR